MSGRPLISERDVLDALRRGEASLAVPEGSLVTALARDTARERGVELRKATRQACCANPPAPQVGQGASDDPSAVIVIGADHGGFDYKQELIAYLQSMGRTCVDLGTDSTESVDYPDFAYAVALAVASSQASLGIMIDGAGLGSAMVCNKIPGVRAACAYNEFTAWNARAHNDANVLTLGSRTLGIEVCKRIVEVFLSTTFEGGRHASRVGKIGDVEARVLAAASAH